MILPLMMANLLPRSMATEVRRKAAAGISGPACSFSFGPTWRAAGFQPIGQNGLRVPLSSTKVDLVLMSSAVGEPGAGGASAAAGEGAALGSAFSFGAAFFAPAPTANRLLLAANDKTKKSALNRFIFSG